MKGYFILGLIFFSLTSNFTEANTYIQTYPYGGRTYIQRQIYNPYSQYSSYARYRRANLNNKQRIKRMQKIRKMNRVRNNLSSYLSWFNRNQNQGVMTGYSVPVNQDIFNQVGIFPNNILQMPSSINCNTDLYSMPSGSEFYYQNGRYYRNPKNVGAKAGVRIIYD